MDLSEGCKAGLEIAICRGNLALASFCFNTLWAQVEGRRWLLHYMPIITLATAWYAISEFVWYDGKDITNWSHRTIHRLTGIPKSLDAGALLSLCLLPEQNGDGPSRIALAPLR